MIDFLDIDVRIETLVFCFSLKCLASLQWDDRYKILNVNSNILYPMACV